MHRVSCGRLRSVRPLRLRQWSRGGRGTSPAVRCICPPLVSGPTVAPSNRRPAPIRCHVGHPPPSPPPPLQCNRRTPQRHNAHDRRNGRTALPSRGHDAPPPPPLCDIPYGCCSFTGPWTVTRSSLRMLRRVAAFCRPPRPVLLRVSCWAQCPPPPPPPPTPPAPFHNCCGMPS